MRHGRRTDTPTAAALDTDSEQEEEELLPRQARLKVEQAGDQAYAEPESPKSSKRRERREVQSCSALLPLPRTAPRRPPTP